MADGAYGLWPLVILNTALFVVFALSFFHPHTGRDWRAMGAYTAFLVALFTEMYGAPLTVYLLSGWLGSRFPLIRSDHAGGHLWNDLIGWTGDPHLSPFHLASYAFIGGGFWLISAGWNVLHASAQKDELAITGPYAKVRHPQYDGFILIMIGFLLQWPTIPTLAMFPVLLVIYTRLARAEEREVEKRFGDTWAVYAATTPAFVPRRAAIWPLRPIPSGSSRPPDGVHEEPPATSGRSGQERHPAGGRPTSSNSEHGQGSSRHRD